METVYRDVYGDFLGILDHTTFVLERVNPSLLLCMHL